MRSNCDILNLEWASKGRDIDIVEPVLTRLETDYQLKVIRESVWYGELKILKNRPKILLMSNYIGADNNARMAKFAHRLGIKTISLISEGDAFVDSTNYDFTFWGWNLDRKCYEDLTLYWTEKNQKIAQRLSGTKEFNIKVSGATGFDRYKFLNYMRKKEFLEKYNKKQYSKVVGISVYPFDFYDGYGYFMEEDGKLTTDKHSRITDLMLLYREANNKIYQHLIKGNRDILFVLKLHPATSKRELSDCKGLFTEENVLVIFTEENIADVINSCDLWVAFESTSCLEAWLLNKVTLGIDPLQKSFPRSKIAHGIPQSHNYEELKVMIDEFYTCGICDDFDSLATKRKDIIKDIIGFDDGRNHVRACDYIMDLYNKNISRKCRVDKFIIEYTFKELTRWLIFNTPLRKLFNSKYKDFQSLYANYNKIERERISERYRKALKTGVIDLQEYNKKI